MLSLLEGMWWHKQRSQRTQPPSPHAEDSDKETAKHWTSVCHHDHTLASLQGESLVPQLVLL